MSHVHDVLYFATNDVVNFVRRDFQSGLENVNDIRVSDGHPDLICSYVLGSKWAGTQQY